MDSSMQYTIGLIIGTGNHCLEPIQGTLATELLSPVRPWITAELMELTLTFQLALLTYLEVWKIGFGRGR
jgi:hypothetical protein